MSIVSTAEEMIIFLKALNECRIISGDTLKLMHNWHKLQFPLQYGYGTMYFKLPRFMNTVMKVPPLWVIRVLPALSFIIRGPESVRGRIYQSDRIKDETV